MNNFIFYGNGNVYQKMIESDIFINVVFNKKPFIIDINQIKYQFKTSERHVEINMEFIDSKLCWIEIFKAIKHKKYIVCLNFDKIESDILPIFYLCLNISPKFILLSENISFINTHFIKFFNIIKVFNNDNKKLLSFEYVICNNIINSIIDDNLLFIKLREYIYDLLIFNCDLQKCIWFILYDINNKKKLSDDFINNTLSYYFQKCYGNSIYNLECLFIMILAEYQKK
uniref:Uncharacterized protein n=1 Tax=viral metagenome TaxID=1070528 RepID=A0A6C0H5P1_9ZZZZ